MTSKDNPVILSTFIINLPYMSSDAPQIKPIRIAEVIDRVTLEKQAPGVGMTVETGENGTVVTVTSEEARAQLLALFTRAGLSVVEETFPGNTETITDRARTA